MKYLLANFKTNKNSIELTKYFDKINDVIKPNNKNIFFINSLYAMQFNNKYKNINIGIQGASNYGLGSYTSSVAIDQIADEKIKYILLGHSEEFLYFNESIKSVNEKLINSINKNLITIVCFGNKRKYKNINKTISYLFKIIKKLLLNIDNKNFEKIILAYEPVWAIGTNCAMEFTQVNEIFSKIKNALFLKYKHKFNIVYGGSVTVNNCQNYLDSKNIDGVLIGKESLDVNKMKLMIEMNK